MFSRIVVFGNWHHSAFDPHKESTVSGRVGRISHRRLLSGFSAARATLTTCKLIAQRCDEPLRCRGIPCDRATSFTGRPASASRSTPVIYSSLNSALRIRPPERRTHIMAGSVFGGQVSEGLAIVCVKFIQIWNVSEER